MRIFILFLSLFLILSCYKETDIPPETFSLPGVWYLKTYSPGFGPTEDIPFGDIVWLFDTENTLSTSVLLTANNQIPLHESGNYLYDSTENTVLIDEVLYTYSIEGVYLTLEDHAAADGITLVFEREGLCGTV